LDSDPATGELRRRIEALETQFAAQETRIDDLQLLFGLTQSPEFVYAMQAFRLTPTEAKLACLFLKRDVLTRGAIELALYGDAECHEKTVRVYEGRLRARLDPHGIQIDTLHGQSWKMGPLAKEALRTALASVRA
jgi:DNA-binding response OmpR family regulator